jgi:hypothetical protein
VLAATRPNIELYRHWMEARVRDRREPGHLRCGCGACGQATSSMV